MFPATPKNVSATSTHEPSTIFRGCGKRNRSDVVAMIIASYWSTTVDHSCSGRSLLSTGTLLVDLYRVPKSFLSCTLQTTVHCDRTGVIHVELVQYYSIRLPSGESHLPSLPSTIHALPATGKYQHQISVFLTTVY